MNKFLNVYLKNLSLMAAVSAGVVAVMAVVIGLTYLLGQFIGPYAILFFAFCVISLVLALMKTGAEWE